MIDADDGSVIVDTAVYSGVRLLKRSKGGGRYLAYSPALFLVVAAGLGTAGVEAPATGVDVGSLGAVGVEAPATGVDVGGVGAVGVEALATGVDAGGVGAVGVEALG